MNMTIEEIISLLRKNRTFLKETFGVTRIGIFGSFVRGEQTSSSDVDMVVEMAKDKKNIHSFLKLKRFLENETARRIDLGFEHSLKPAIREKIMKQIIYV